jgi:hypothetical protein
MKMNMKMLDPTNNIVEEKIIDLPISIFKGEGEPMSKNYYIIELGNIKLHISKTGIISVI